MVWVVSNVNDGGFVFKGGVVNVTTQRGDIQARRECVLNILCGRYPFKVRAVIVKLVAVSMIDFGLVIGIRQEAESDETMNLELFRLAVFREVDA